MISTSMWAKHKQPGFTIVELLIVIVVIGILAAITIVAYNGIQTRGENTKTVNGVGEYAKAFALYAADNGVYPSTGGSYPCLGQPTDDFCAKIVTTDPGCNWSGGTYTTTAFNNLLTPYLGSSKPSISNQTMTCIGDVYRGAYVDNNASNTKNLMIRYHLKGDQPCTSPGGTLFSTRVQNNEVTKCTVRMPSL